MTYLLSGIQFIFNGSGAQHKTRGAPEHVAMPIMIWPGTVSTNILASGKLPPLFAAGGVIDAVDLTSLLKGLHDFVTPRNEKLIERYAEVMAGSPPWSSASFPTT